jgi:hypothetical protein
MDEMVAAFIGAFVGGLMVVVSNVLMTRSQARRKLNAAALMCLDRLEKIRMARKRAEEEGKQGSENLQEQGDGASTFDHERYLLGGDLDRYLEAISRIGRGKKHEQHWKWYTAVARMHRAGEFEDPSLGRAIAALDEFRRRELARPRLFGRS